LSPVVQTQLDRLRAFDHVRVLEAIEEKLQHEPLTRTRHRKPLEGLPPLLVRVATSILGDVDAVWELRVIPWRVIYAVEGRVVHVLWLLRKDRQTTDDALS
jgi:hypothetical protein